MGIKLNLKKISYFNTNTYIIYSFNVPFITTDQSG